MQSRAGLVDLVNANDIRGVFGQNLFERHAITLGAAIADHFGRRKAKGTAADSTGVLIGFDGRVSSPVLAEALAAGVRSRGVAVTWLGFASTDQVYFASGQRQAPAVMITASHNPGEYNGFKVCGPGAKPVGREQGLADIAAAADDLDDMELALVTKRIGAVHSWDSLPEYSQFLRELAGLSGDPHHAPAGERREKAGKKAKGHGASPRRLKIVVDAANGMAGITAPAVLGVLGWVDLVALYCDVDGTFPNHPADPLNYANLADLRSAVREHEADLGLAFDGDADRCFFIDERGEIVSPSAVTALVASREITRELVAQGGAAKDGGPVVVHNAITSRIVPETIEACGGRAVVSRVGHAYVKSLMAEHSAVFGGEHSAHYYFRDFYFADSGLLAALHVLAALQDHPESSVAELTQQYDPYVASGEINSRVGDTEAAVRRVRERFASKKRQVSEFDGLSISNWLHPDPAKRWWLNVRVSNTEPLLRLNVEAIARDTLEHVRDLALELIREAPATPPEALAAQATNRNEN
ncbi:phosphomannomutase/phosphoglucomutase [Micrococcales bacterium 31B]|nr:phosphomannomutase/phosphoglucomutase [Micrococcales bacterium 31B]